MGVDKALAGFVLSSAASAELDLNGSYYDWMRFLARQLRQRSPRGSVRIATAICAVLLATGACGSDDDLDTRSTAVDAGDAKASQVEAGPIEPVDVVASFYPLEFVVAQVGGDRVAVKNLTPAGVEPHDLEITARATADLSEADLVVFLSSFSPALDEAIVTAAPATSLDVAASADLDLSAGDEHEDEGAGDVQDDVDPHFWLDPIRLANVAEVVAERLALADPGGSVTFASNAIALRARLEGLDVEYQTGLSDCASTNLVTSHTAFAYLAARYGLTQVGISGLSPEADPSPAALAEVTEFVRDHDVRTIFYETLVDPAVAETVANETGATTAVLDPLEGLTEASQGSDYIEVMRANLANLRDGLGCT